MPENKIIEYYCLKELLLSEVIRNRYQKYHQNSFSFLIYTLIGNSSHTKTRTQFRSLALCVSGVMDTLQAHKAVR